MATTITWTNILDQVLDDVPGLGYKFTGTANASGATVATTDPKINSLGANAPANRFQSRLLYIPTASGADQIHSITTISVSGATTTITTLGTYGSTYTSVAMYLLGEHPDILRNLGNDALELIPVECPIPLRHGPDSADMQGSSVDADWTESGATDTVQTTAAEVLFGVQSLVVTNAGANDYTQSTTMRISHSQRVTSHFIGKADTGQGEFAIFDNSSNEEGVVNFTQEDWTYGRKSVDFGTADEGAFIRLRGDGASDSIDWQWAWMVKHNNPLFRLPSWVDRRFKIARIERWDFLESGNEADTWLAESYEATVLREGEDWRFTSRRADVHSNTIHLLRKDLWEVPLVVVVECHYDAPYGVSATFSADTSTTTCHLHLIVAKVEELLGERYPESFPDLKAKSQAKYEMQRQVESTETPKREVRPWRFFG